MSQLAHALTSTKNLLLTSVKNLVCLNPPETLHMRYLKWVSEELKCVSFQRHS